MSIAVEPGEAVLIYTDEDPDVGIYTTVQRVDEQQLVTRYGTIVPVPAIRRIERVVMKQLAPVPEFEEPLPVLYQRPADAAPSDERVQHHVVGRFV